MEEKLKRIEDKIDKLQRSIDLLIDDNDNIIKNNCKKMGTHIEFIEKIILLRLHFLPVFNYLGKSGGVSFLLNLFVYIR